MSKYDISSDMPRNRGTGLLLSPALLPLVNMFLAARVNKMKPVEGLGVRKVKIPGYRAQQIELTIYEPEEIEHGAPCLIYLHGGAFVLKAAPHHRNMVCEYALKTPCKVVFVDYRLAPKHPFPVGVEDCYSAFEWVSRNTRELGIDADRIGIGGDSAGGALAAAVSLMARNRKARAMCFQMLIYPVTDARQETQSIAAFVDTPMWNARLNERMWKLYLRPGMTGNREYASPAEATSLENVPDSYIEVSEYDCLRDEGVRFAEALQRSGVGVELHRTRGTVHGFDIAQNSETVHRSVARRIEALKRGFRITTRQ